MNTESVSSFFDRTVAYRRPAWATTLLVLIVYLPALVAAAGDAGPAGLLTNPRLRAILTAPTVIAYVLIIAPLLATLQPVVIRSLRPVMQVDDRELERILQRAASVPPRHEAAAIVGGLLFGFFIIQGNPGPGARWPFYVEVATDYVMFGLLGWLGLMSLTNTRFINALLRLPLRVDPLDITPFEAIGRQSLALALAFVGGNLIALFLGNYGPAALADPRFWLLFLPLFLLPVVVFFLNMIPTQRILSQAKRRELSAVRGQLHAAFRLLLARQQADEPTGPLAQDIVALTAYEQHLNEAHSWPYNIGILRALLLSVLVQVVAVLTRRILGA